MKVAKQTRQGLSAPNYAQAEQKNVTEVKAGKQTEDENALNDDEKLTDEPNPPLPMTAPANWSESA